MDIHGAAPQPDPGREPPVLPARPAGGHIDRRAGKGRGVRPPLVLDSAAGAADIAGMRRAFTDWLAVDLDPGELLDDLVLAVYEALANAAEHAYAHTSTHVGPVHLTAHRTRHGLDVTVSDHGRWAPAAQHPFRGHGLAVIRQVVQHVHIASTDAGTVVHLRTALPEPRPGRAPADPR